MMELWARKRPIQGKGNKYEMILRFENEEYIYTAFDILDRDIYQEAMIIKDNNCVAYVEFEEPYVKRR